MECDNRLALFSQNRLAMNSARISTVDKSLTCCTICCEAECALTNERLAPQLHCGPCAPCSVLICKNRRILANGRVVYDRLPIATPVFTHSIAQPLSVRVV